MNWALVASGSKAMGRALIRVLVVGALLSAAATCGSPAVARAGTWTLVGCTLPTGQPAPTDGWTVAQFNGPGTGGSGDVDSCAQGGSLAAIEAGYGVNGDGPEWLFTAPPASTIAGGLIVATVTAPHGETWLATPGDSNAAADAFGYCAFNTSCTPQSGSFAIQHPGGTNIYAVARCIDSSGTCPATDGVNAQVSIHSAQIELSNGALPAGSGFSGPLLDPLAHGVADLLFTASDPNLPTPADPAPGYGPGVYSVTATLDGTTAYTGTPDTNGGACVPIAGGPAGGGMMFETAQPCRPVESVDVPVDTRSVGDGNHDLRVIVTDAAGNAATVLDRTISTSNPTVTPRPHNPRRVQARLTIHWRWLGAWTWLELIRARGVPRDAVLTVSCHGAGCPRLPHGAVAAAHVSRLWRALRGRRFRAGDRLLIAIAAPHRLAERIELRIEDGRLPHAQLL